MYLKISVLLLTGLIYTESAPTKKGGKALRELKIDLRAGPSNRPIIDEDEGLAEEYNTAKWRLEVPNERGFNEVEMAKYAGINVAELKEIAILVSINNLENINLNTFKLLMKVIKMKRCNTINESHIELGVGLCITPTTDKVLEMAYGIAKLDHGVLGNGSGLNESQMANQAGITVEELKEIAKSISIDNLDNINLKTFKLLTNAISKKKDASIREPKEELETGPSNRPTLDEDEVLKLAYGFAKIDHGVLGRGRGLNEFQMAKRADISVQELRVIASSIAIENLDNINLKTFKLLVNAISKNRGVSIRKPQGVLEAGPSNRLTVDEDEDLELAYGFAKIHHGVLGKRRGLNESQMAICVGITVPELRVIASSIAIENLGNIDLKYFVELAKKISGIKGVPIVDF